MQIDRKLFTDQFAAVAAAVPSRTTKDMLKNVKLVARGMKVTLSATDGELHVVSEFECNCAPFEALLPAAKVLSILREVDCETIEIESGTSGVTLTCGQSIFRLSTEDPVGFPPSLSFNAESWFHADGDTFRQAVKRTLFCTDQESVRYALGGVCIEFAADGAVLIATDSRRLSVSPCYVESVNQPAFGKVVVPARAMKLVEQSTGNDIRIAFTDRGVSFQVGGLSISSQLVEGRFPDWRRVVPQSKDITSRVTLPTGPLASVVRQASILRTEESRGLDMAFARDTLTVTLTTADIGSAKTSMPITLDGEAITVTLDGRWLLDVLKVLGSDVAIDLGLISHDDRVLLNCGNYQHVIMPLARE